MQPRRTLRPSIHRYPRKHPADHSPDTLGPLCDAASDAAKREVAQWFLFLLVMLVLATLVGGTTHRMLFLEEPIKVPVLEVNLPLLGFYWAAPAVFLLMHFYVLAQVRELARKVTAYLTAAERDANGNTAAFLAHRHRLDIFPVVGMLANQRLGQPGIAMAAMVWSTLAIMPVLLLVFIQVQFLPYHNDATTWWHRTAIALDLGLLWWLWPRSQSGARWRRWTMRAVGGVMTGFVVAFAFTLALIPDEFLETQADKTMPVAAITRKFLFDGPLDEVSRQRTSIFTRSLVLPEENFLTAEEQKKLSELGDKAPETAFRTRVLRGRNLRYAILDRADLRYADLTGATLSDASMFDVKLTRARLDSAKMQGASLDGAELQGASLDGAHMQGASLDRAQLQGASLDGAQMQGASLYRAQMQGASLYRAQMQGARLNAAQMQGARLDEAQMQGASLDRAQMQGASLARAQLQGASLDRAQLQGASLDGAQMQGATLLGVDGWRLHGLGTAINFARLGVRFEQRLMREQWESLVDKWLFLIPAGELRDRARERLSVLLDTQDPANAERIRLAWTNHSQPSDSDRINFLGNVACNPSGNPFIARGILSQIRFDIRRLIQPMQKLLAARMLQDDCAGAKGLTADERELLAAIAADPAPNQ